MKNRIVTLLSLLCLVGCQTTPTQHLIEQVVVQAAVMKVVENNPSYGLRIVEISKVVQQGLSGDLTASISTINSLIRNEIHWEKLKPSDRLIVDTLLSAIDTALQEKVGSGVLTQEKLLKVAEVAHWVELAASAVAPQT